MSDYPMLISNKLHSFRNFWVQRYEKAADCQIKKLHDYRGASRVIV